MAPVLCLVVLLLAGTRTGRTAAQETGSAGAPGTIPLPEDSSSRDQTAASEVSNPYAARLRQAQIEHGQTHQLVKAIRARLESMNERVLSLGLNDGNRMLLEENRRMLPSVSASRARIAWVQQEIRRLNMELLRLGPLAANAPLAAGGTPAVPDAGAESPPGSLCDPPGVSAAQAELDSLHEYSLELGHLAAEHSLLIEQVAGMEKFLNRQLMWVANADPLSIQDVQGLLEGSRALADPGPWMELGGRISGRLRTHFWHLVLVLGLVIGVGVVTGRLEKAMRGVHPSG